MGSTESTLGTTSSTIEFAENTTTTTNATMEHNNENNNNKNVEKSEFDTNILTATNDATAPRSSENDDWWWEIENTNLILEQTPNAVSLNATTNTTTTETTTTTAVTSVESVIKRIERKRAESLRNSQISSSTEENNQVEHKEAAAILTKCDTVAAVNNNATVDESTTCKTYASEEDTMESFKEDLRLKRLARQTAVQDLREELHTLRKRLADAGIESDKTNCADALRPTTTTTTVSATENILAKTAVDDIDTDDEDPMRRSRHANIELANAQLALQLANAENLSLRTELGVVQKQVGHLKEVISCCKQMLNVKEEQCTQLKGKLDEIEASLAEREVKLMSSNLRAEYERQLGNIRQLRDLYDERQRISAAEHENLQRLIAIKRDELKAEQEKTKHVEERNQTLLKEVEHANTELAKLREECNEHKFEKKALMEEMGAVNTLFSQLVMGFNGKNNLDIDRLTMMLEENRTLLNDMATKEVSNCSDGATLPKLLFELVEQAAVASGKNTSDAAAVSPLHSAAENKITVISDDDDDVDIDNDDEEQHVVEFVDNAAAAAVVNVNTTTNIDEVAANLAEQTGASTIDMNTAAADANDDAVGAIAICYGNSQEQPVTATTVPLTATTTTERKLQTLSTTDSSSVLGATKSGKRHYRRTQAATIKATDASTTQAHSTKTMKFADPEVIGKVVSTQEIIGNLPKVWKVLMELLSHHKIERVQFEENGAGEDCYKSVETPNGIKTELSVSQTYIKLKDLILEKKALVKETSRLKTLNGHLDYRLNEQEKRLSSVSLELTKTWHLVGKMQRQHRQLHTQEQILRYQLQQKRRLLNELKEELEYCRRKWAKARAINDESQEQYDDLRREFAKRKLEDANNSTESGYSDSGPPSDEEVTVPAAPAGACRRKILREMFEHTRKIKRMQSTSPGRAAYDVAQNAPFNPVVLLRCNSAPPTCSWRNSELDIDYDDNDDEEKVQDLLKLSTSNVLVNRGAIPKTDTKAVKHTADADEMAEPEEQANRIQRLEAQCKSLIQQVLETSDNRERLEIQLCRFQDDITPVQFAVPLDNLINRKRLERMTRASSVPATGCLTPREEEYTRKRSERLDRLEEDSRKLMSRIRRTADRGHYLRCSVDRLRRAPSREGSLESNTDEDSLQKETDKEQDIEQAIALDTQVDVALIHKIDETVAVESSPLTSEEEAYTARRAARLQRLEEESKALLATVSCHAQREVALDARLNGECADTENAQAAAAPALSIEKRINNIDKISEQRAERLRILEEEGKALLQRLSNRSARGTAMINRIAERQKRMQEAQQAKEEAMAAESSAEIQLTESGESVLKENAACSSIANDELSDGLVVTTIPIRIAAQHSSGPIAKLSASRARTSRRNSGTTATERSPAETLEDLVRSLREIPLPRENAILQQIDDDSQAQSTDTTNIEQHDNAQ